MAPKLLVVVGITGNQGGSVANHFLKDPSWKIRGIVRDPSKASAQAWSAKGVELAKADLDDLESLEKAFIGADAIFAMTDYWVPMGEGTTQIAAEKQGISVNELCHHLEIQRGKNLALAAVKVPSLQRYVYSALGPSSELSKGKYKNMWHFESKAAVERFIRESPSMEELAKKSSFLHVGLYVDNWTKGVGFDFFVKDQSSQGWLHPDQGDGNRKIPFIWTIKDTGVLVEALFDAEPGKTLLGYSEYLTWKEFMAVWARTLGVRLHDEGFRTVTWNDVHSVVPAETMKLHMADSFGYMAEFGYHGDDHNVLLPSDLGIEDKLTPVEEYIKQEDWSPLLIA